MAAHVFISYATPNREVAEQVCAGLEARNVNCWVASRDATPGESYGGEIIRAIHSASSMVLIFSTAANTSRHVLTEVERAFSRGLRIFPFRIENISLSADLEYFLSSPQWVDAFGNDLPTSLERLFAHVEAANAQGVAKPRPSGVHTEGRDGIELVPEMVGSQAVPHQQPKPTKPVAPERGASSGPTVVPTTEGGAKRRRWPWVVVAIAGITVAAWAATMLGVFDPEPQSASQQAESATAANAAPAENQGTEDSKEEAQR